MATYSNLKFITGVAGEDLRDKQSRLVKFDGTSFSVCEVGDPAFGVVFAGSRSGGHTTVTYRGNMVVEAGGTFSAGDSLQSDADGRVIVHTDTNPIIGVALSDGVVGQRVQVQFIGLSGNGASNAESFVFTSTISPGGGDNLAEERPRVYEDADGVLWRVSGEWNSGNLRADSRFYVTPIAANVGVTPPTAPVQIASVGGQNNHYDPVIGRLPNGNPVVMRTLHNQLEVYQDTPDDPADLSGTWSTVRVDSDIRGTQTGAAYTYSLLCEAPNITTPALFWFSRRSTVGVGNNGKVAYSKNTGTGWSQSVDVVDFNGLRPYRIISNDIENGIAHFGISPSNPGDANVDDQGIYYFQMDLDDETARAQAGDAALTLPITTTSQMKGIYFVTGRSSWIMDTRHYPNGDVCFTFWSTPSTFAPGNELLAHHARMDSSGNVTVTDIGPIWEIVSGIAGVPGVVLDPNDSNKVYMGQEATAGGYDEDTQRNVFHTWTLSGSTWTKGAALANLEYGHGIEAYSWQGQTIVSLASGVGATDAFINPRPFSSNFDRITSSIAFDPSVAISDFSTPWVVDDNTAFTGPLAAIAGNTYIYDLSQPATVHPVTAQREPLPALANGARVTAVRDAQNRRLRAAGINDTNPRPLWNTNGYLTFDGTSVLQAQNATWGGSNFLLAARVRFDALNAFNQIFCSHYGGSTTFLALQARALANGSVELITFRPSGGSVRSALSASGAVTTGTWYTLGFVADGTDCTVWLDGTQIATVSQGGTLRSNGDFPLTIGARITSTTSNDNPSDILEGDIAGMFLCPGSYPGDTARDTVFTRLSALSPT